MFKNLILYRIHEGAVPSLTDLQACLERAQFLPCSATQERSLGWVPPRAEAEGALVESIAGQWMLRCMRESKMLPASVVQRRVEEKAQQIEATTGRKPGKKERRDLKEEARLDLLPRAFTQQGSMWVWIDPQARLLALDAGSQARADEVVTLLIESVPGLSVSLLNTRMSPQSAMAHWLLTQEAPAGFSIDRECELKSPDESKAVVRYARHPLDIEEVRLHVEQGKLPTRLAMTWEDRVSFVLTEALQLRKMELLETVTEAEAMEEANFDGDVALVTGELSELIPDLIAALDGEGDVLAAAPSVPLTSKGNAVVTGPETVPVDNLESSPPF